MRRDVRLFPGCQAAGHEKGEVGEIGWGGGGGRRGVKQPRSQFKLF